MRKRSVVSFLLRKPRSPPTATEMRFWIVDAHRGDGKQLFVRTNAKLTAFLELESATRACGELS
jgi:hypothetical protein